jgi:hypothetical protein
MYPHFRFKAADVGTTQKTTLKREHNTQRAPPRRPPALCPRCARLRASHARAAVPCAARARALAPPPRPAAQLRAVARVPRAPRRPGDAAACARARPHARSAARPPGWLRCGGSHERNAGATQRGARSSAERGARRRGPGASLHAAGAFSAPTSLPPRAAGRARPRAACAPAGAGTHTRAPARAAKGPLARRRRRGARSGGTNSRAFVSYPAGARVWPARPPPRAARLGRHGAWCRVPTHTPRTSRGPHADARCHTFLLPLPSARRRPHSVGRCPLFFEAGRPHSRHVRAHSARRLAPRKDA